MIRSELEKFLYTIWLLSFPMSDGVGVCMEPAGEHLLPGSEVFRGSSRRKAVSRKCQFIVESSNFKTIFEWGHWVRLQIFTLVLHLIEERTVLKQAFDARSACAHNIFTKI